jgi:hypothetical protein
VCGSGQACVLNACTAASADSGVVDAGIVDSGVVDAGIVDSGVVDAGIVDSGVVDAGVVDSGVVDAGPPCATAPLDAVLGTFSLVGTTTVTSSGAVPAGTSAFGVHNGQLYAVTSARTVNLLGVLPSLALGPAIADIRPEADRDAGTFVSGYLASNGQQLLAGYTKTGAGFPGNVALISPADGGVEYVPASGNYSAAALSGGGAFIINGLGLQTATGNGLFALRPGTPTQGSLLALFPDAFGGSGDTAITTTGVVLAGNFRSDFTSVVRALTPSQYAAGVANGTSFTYTMNDAPVVAEGAQVANVTALGPDAVVVRGGFDANFVPFTLRVERLPLTLAGSGTQTVTVGTPVVLLQNGPLQCTRVFTAFSSGTSLYLGLSDRQGRRLVQLSP